jgi:hypothetical protein
LTTLDNSVNPHQQATWVQLCIELLTVIWNCIVIAIFLALLAYTWYLLWKAQKRLLEERLRQSKLRQTATHHLDDPHYLTFIPDPERPVERLKRAEIQMRHAVKVALANEAKEKRRRTRVDDDAAVEAAQYQQVDIDALCESSHALMRSPSCR